MPDTHAFLENLALALCTAAVTTVVFQRLKQPVIFGYLLAGMIVGPHIPLPLVADEEMVRMLAELGVILLMFSLGLEFSLRRVLQLGPTAGLIAIAETSVMLWLGYVLGQLLGWTTLESVFAGAVIAISSTTIIVKAFDERGTRGKFTEVVLGILIFEDLVAIFLLAVITTVSEGSGFSAGSLAMTAMRLATFLVGLIGVGLLVIPRTMRAVVRMGRPETTLVASVGICFAAALLALAFGYSVALGAFIAGSLVAESGEEKIVEQLVRPVRDMFAAIFFVAVGMLIDPLAVVRHWDVVLIFTLAVMIGKVVAVTVSAFLTGYSPRTAVQSGMSLTQIGEFSFIIAGVGLATGATRDFLYPVVVTVSAITTLTTPWLIRAAGPVAEYVDRHLPESLQTFVSLYGSWIERVRRTPMAATGRSRTRQLVGLLLLDGVLIVAAVIGASLQTDRIAVLLVSWTGLPGGVARTIVLVSVAAVGLPLIFGLMRTARLLALEFALKSFPPVAPGKVDPAAAPRGALVVTLQLAIVASLGVPIVAVTQPFLPAFRLALGLLALLVILVIAFWRSTTNLQGHAQAGAEVIAMALAQHLARDADPEHLGSGMERLRSVLPGLGEPVSLLVPPGSPVANRTLADLNLRAVTGATVLAILRGGEQLPSPSGSEIVRVGDVLAVAGTDEASDAVRALVMVPHVESPGDDVIPTATT